MMGSDGSDPEAGDDESMVVDGNKQKRPVHIEKSFYMGVTEVTRGQFRTFVDETSHKTEADKDGKGGWGWDEAKKKFRQDPKYTWLNPGFEQTDDHPVVIVSWNDAVAFCEWLSSKEAQRYRLPTEAEWEYACRAGSTTRYYSGDDPEALATVGNVADGTAKAKYPNWWSAIAAKDGYVYTAPVARFRADALGLYDMHGNVYEWCQDWYDKDYYQLSPVEDPLCLVKATQRVIRGGSWFSESARLPDGVPGRVRSGRRDGYLGFRVARAQSNR